MALLLPVAAFLVTGLAYADGGEELTAKHKCTSCHKLDKKSIGPSYQDIAKKYAGNAGAAAQATEHVKKGSRGVWGPAPMPPQSAPDEDIKAMVDYILAQKK
ncbi:MAG: c-type cytochrome [Burkholderiales bacterium]|nr:c-type cytochrome [Burkholderiales bacterium]